MLKGFTLDLSPGNVPSLEANTNVSLCEYNFYHSRPLTLFVRLYILASVISPPEVTTDKLLHLSVLLHFSLPPLLFSCQTTSSYFTKQPALSLKCLQVSSPNPQRHASLAFPKTLYYPHLKK